MDARMWDDHYRSKDLVWGAEANRWVVREAADLPPGNALDLAAGEGRNTLWLAARGWQVTAADFSSVALDRGRQLAAGQPAEVAERITWLRTDVTNWTPDEAAFGLVLLVYVHLPSQQRGTLLRRAARAVAPGGTLLVVGHDTTNITDGFGGPQDPEVLFTPEDVLTDLADAGLRSVRAERVRRTVTRPDGEPAEAIDALVRLTRPGGSANG